jgi:predicted nucleic acid-binding protein
MILFDADIFIWIQRGHARAARVVDDEETRFLSVQTSLELLQNAQNKKQHQQTKDFLKTFDFIILPFTENIGHRACVYIEAYALSTGLRTGDAIIAATAAENNLTLMTSDTKHFKGITDLKLKII